MEKVFLQVLTMAFGGVLAFIIANTAVGIMVPIFDGVANSMPFVDKSQYNSLSGIFQGAFFTAAFIVVCIPFAYLFMRTLRKEPEPQQYGGYGGY